MGTKNDKFLLLILYNTCTYILLYTCTCNFRSGSLKVGDILLTINGVSVVNETPHEAAALLTSSGERISLSIRREATNNFSKLWPLSVSTCSFVHAMYMCFYNVHVYVWMYTSVFVHVHVHVQYINV